MKRWIWTACLALMVLGAARLALAQDDGTSAAGNEKLQRRIETLWMMKMTEELDLDDATAQKLGDIVRKSQLQIRENQKALAQALRTVRDAEQAGKVLPTSQILDLVKKAMEARQKTESLRLAQFTDASKVLDDAKFQKFVVLQAKFWRDIVQRARDARGQTGGQAPRQRWRQNTQPAPEPGPEEF
jgi:Spy/CpxP family protein refolding chaperone